MAKAEKMLTPRRSYGTSNMNFWFIGALLRTLRQKYGILSTKGFINITDGKNFVKVEQKSDGIFQIKKVISQAEGIWKYNDGNDDSRDNGSSQWLRLMIKIIIFKWVLESSDRGIFGDRGKHSARQETALPG